MTTTGASKSFENYKKRKREALESKNIVASEKRYFIQLVNGDDNEQKAGPILDLDAEFNVKQLNEVLNKLLKNDDTLPYSFFVETDEITNSIKETLMSQADLYADKLSVSTQDAPLKITYYPQALFRVRPVTRCTASMPGHSEAVLQVQFSPDGRLLASASGDATVRLWDLDTETPLQTLKGHENWVLTLAWSPDGKKVASGGKDNLLKCWWDSGKKCSKPLRGHKKWITAVAWEPYHLNVKCNRFASASKDETIRIWDVILSKCETVLSGHTKGITALKWGGDGNLYSSAQDCTIRVWSVAQKTCVKILSGHAHWVNTMAMSTDYVLRRGAFDFNCEPLPSEPTEEDLKKLQEAAKKRYEDTLGKNPLRIVTGSDDFTLCIWEPENSEKPITRMTGHKGIVNQVCFSPDGRMIASASFDKTVKTWDASSGKFLTTLRGHVGHVYQVCWSGDSRLVCSSSKDATAKVWDVHSRKLMFDLPGHSDEVFTADWAPDGQRVATAGKDRMIKIWKH